ncbi:MAG TPA: hypothetical protein VKG23_07735 [Thermoanaerobaculia bacterium]|nr:hypothetical protein [Thermoanaerobaculia bacterium]
MTEDRHRSRARLIFFLILVLRISMASVPLATYDAISYSIVAQAVAAGQNVYAATNRYNYSPLWAGISGALWGLSGGRLSLFVLLVGLLVTAADAATALVLRGLARDRGASEPEAARVSLLYFSNPVSVLVAGYLRQFDGIAILFLLLAVRASSRARSSGRFASVYLALSLLVKHVAAAHPLLFWRRRDGRSLSLPLVLAPYVVFGLSFAPFLSNASAGSIRDNVLLYGTWLRGSRGQMAGGLHGWFAVSGGSTWPFFAILVGGVLCGLVLGRRRPLPEGALLLFLAQIVFAPGFAAQYLLWPMALGSLAVSAGYVWTTTVGALFIVTAAGLLSLPVAVTATAAWTAALLWFLQEARREPVWSEASGAPGLQTSSTPSG